MEIKTKTEYTVERLIKFNTVHAFKNKLIWVIYIGFTSLILAGTIATVVKGIKTGNYGGLLMYVLVLAAAIAYDTYVVIKNFVIPRKKIKEAPIVGATFKVIFREDGIEVFGHLKSNDSHSAHSYLSLETVIKKGNELYLYVNKNNAYIVDASPILESELLQIKEAVTKKVKNVKWN